MRRQNLVLILIIINIVYALIAYPIVLQTIYPTEPIEPGEEFSPVLIYIHIILIMGCIVIYTLWPRIEIENKIIHLLRDKKPRTYYAISRELIRKNKWKTGPSPQRIGKIIKEMRKKGKVREKGNKYTIKNP